MVSSSAIRELKPEEKEYVVDSGASMHAMHMSSRKDLNSAELETVRISESPTTVMTAHGDVPTKEEATYSPTSYIFIAGKRDSHGASSINKK